MRVFCFAGLIVGVLMGSLAIAQERERPDDPRLPGGDKSTGFAAPLTVQILGDLLNQLGHPPEVVTLNSGQQVLRISLKRDGLTMPLDVERSADGTKIWLSSWFKALDAKLQIPPKIMLKMLDANSLYGPVHFQYNGPTRQLVLALALDNRGLTGLELQRQIEVFAKVYAKTEPLWNPAKWGGTAQN